MPGFENTQSIGTFELETAWENVEMGSEGTGCRESNLE